MSYGFIKSINDKAYGFVRTDQRDYFFHKNDFNGYWTDLVNDFKNLGPDNTIEVEFDIRDSPKGLCAQNVRRLDW